MVITLVMDQYGDANNGTTMTARRFAKILTNHGHTVRVLCGSNIDGPNIYSTGYVHVPVFQWLITSQGMAFAKVNKKVIFDAVNGADIVHFLLPFRLSQKTKKICDKLNIPTTAAFHCQPENITYTLHMGKSKFANSVLYFFFRKFYNRFNDIHCPSIMIEQQLLKHNYKASTHVISNGVIPGFYKKPVDKPINLKDKFIILMIGRYSREKRQDLIINATLNSENEKDIQLIFAGSGPWEKYLKKISNKLTNKPIFGFYSSKELLNIINYSDLYIHASDAEIEAISCIESFTCGLVPVISDSPMSATNQFALRESNLFKAGDYLSLRDKIDFWIKHEKEKNNCSKEYINYSVKFQIENCVLALEKVFEDVVNKNKH